jgi:cytoplasmic iron level regulating protein YaaA (DUF328/UPF0246 family)
MKIALIPCGSKKRDGKHPAKDLYIGTLFKKQLGHALTHSDKVFILSGKYGLLPLDAEIETYNLSVKNMTKNEKITWGLKISAQILDNTNLDDELIFYTGKEYHTYIIPFLKNKYQIVMKNYTIFQRMKWLTDG